MAAGPDRAELAAVAPRPVDAGSGRLYSILSDGSANPDAPWVPCDFTIASGMLIPRAAWRAVGPMRADLFIDPIDTDWCLRARAGGQVLAIVPQARLQHRLGDGGQRLWLGRWRWLPVHSLLRRYVRVRNSRWLDGQSHAVRSGARQTQVRALSMVLLSLVFLPIRRERVRMVWQGWKDAADGRMGAWLGRKPEAVAPGAHPLAAGRQPGRTEGPLLVHLGMD